MSPRTAYPFLVILAIAVIDCQVKGRKMVSHKWHDNPKDPRPLLPQFWRDRGVIAWRTVLAGLLLLGCLIPSSPWDWIEIGFSMNWQPFTGCLILGSCGVESCFYWWLLKPFGIKQHVWWGEPDTVVTYGGGRAYVYPPAGWFSYPPSAPWLRVLPGFWWIRVREWMVLRKMPCPEMGLVVFKALGGFDPRPTRRDVYTVASIGSVAAILLGVL